MPGPVEPKLLRRSRAARVSLVAGVVVGFITAALTLVQGRVLADAVTFVFSGSGLSVLPQATAVLIGVFGAKAFLSWASQWLGRRSAARVKTQLRGEIVEAVFAKPLGAARASGGLVNLVTQGLDALDDYFAKYLPQLGLAATVPPLVVVVVFFCDITSSMIMLATIPLIPVFMALVGWTTQARTAKRWKIQNRLANHFADLITGLPTLQSFGRARAQLKGLAKIESAHRKETAGVLRLSFLSSLTLELLSTISVAIVAVTIGMRV
ncbi:MAG: thiol reductant ABC exporter subunit CydD, partial [Propionibacteriaceae bacterium]|nr:thiol reductant ABC exporter subunit CydD [Propionibacteriaceae bacterium]